MTLTVQEMAEDLEFAYEQQSLMTYVRNPQDGDSPMATAQYPYIHPLRTLSGHEVTEVKPATHPYQHGLFLSAQNVAESNFWGPATYLPVHGYVLRDDRGDIRSQKHEVYGSAGAAGVNEKLHWVSKQGMVLLEEDRVIEVERVDPAESCWVLRFSYTLRNVTDEWIHFATPGSDGRKDSTGRPGWGYSGLFWRGPMSMQNGLIVGPETSGEQQLDGDSTAWLGYVGRVAAQESSTLIFVNDPENHTTWYANSSEYPGVGFGIAARQRRFLAPTASLTRNHRVCIADGSWNREKMSAYVAGL
ncbi:DUF6807 family protein [Streptomyces platensis]|uniref:DUF6807 family protein n=1 Tax=Streptomyces platensis TaxID=58346 RepID=UPI001F4613C0|nr:DUF6807 family protein [Streptomyces platensis]MCF3145199.1 PmoA family protein [Streptomyces platensis]